MFASIDLSSRLIWGRGVSDGRSVAAITVQFGEQYLRQWEGCARNKSEETCGNVVDGNSRSTGE